MFEDDKTELSVIKKYDISQENLLEEVEHILAQKRQGALDMGKPVRFFLIATGIHTNRNWPPKN